MKKKIAGLLLATTLVVSFAGCGTASKNTDSADNTKTETTQESSAQYPITIEHAYGETVIESQPKNIVTISWENGDTPLALGLVPTGVSEANYGKVTENRLHAWTDAAFAKNGEDSPNVFNDTDGWDYEAIADANPDVILASYSGITEEEYQTLSEIAPVVPFKEAAFQTTWRNQTIENATALGMKEEGQKLVDETDALIQEKLAAYPQLAGKKTAFMRLSADDLSQFYVYLPVDPRAAFLEDLGMVLPDSVKEMSKEGEFSITVSREQAEKLKDVEMIVTYGDEDLLKAMQSDKLLSQIPAVANGAVVLLDNNTDLAAGTTPSILSIPYTIDEYLEVLGKAADQVK